MSELKVNKISPRSGTNLTIGDSGDTTNIVGTLNNNGATLLSLANGVDNRVITSSSANALNGEANLTFDGSTLGVNGAAIFNESGADKDFRVESDGNANMLLVDGGTNRVGIGTSGPSTTLDVAPSGSDLIGLNIRGRSSDNKSRIEFRTNDNSAVQFQIESAPSAASYIKVVPNQPLIFRTNNVDRVQINGSGVLSASAGIALGVGIASTASNVLDDYEEGTWTPADVSGASLSLSVTGTAKYVKIGNTVFFTVDRIVYPSTSNTASAALGGLPFTNTGNNIGIHTIITANANAHKGLLISSSTKIFFYAEQTETNSSNANLSGASLYGISGVYTI